MTTPLQQAAQAVITRWNSKAWKDQPHTAEFVEQLRKALDAEITQSVEPYAVFRGLVDSGEHGAFNLDLLKMIPRGAYLYLHPPQQSVCTSDEWLANCPQSVRDLANKIKAELHPPQPQATTPAAPTLTETLAQQGIKLRTEFEPKQRDSELATETGGERAGLIERQRWVQENGANPAMRALAKSTADMLEADAQQAKPTDWSAA